MKAQVFAALLLFVLKPDRKPVIRSLFFRALFITAVNYHFQQRASRVMTAVLFYGFSRTVSFLVFIFRKHLIHTHHMKI